MSCNAIWLLFLTEREVNPFKKQTITIHCLHRCYNHLNHINTLQHYLVIFACMYMVKLIQQISLSWHVVNIFPVVSFRQIRQLQYIRQWCLHSHCLYNYSLTIHNFPEIVVLKIIYFPSYDITFIKPLLPG